MPTRAAAELLRQTVEHQILQNGRAALVLPDVVTRAEWLERLHASLPDAPPLLSRSEREVLFARAGREVADRRRLAALPFHLRPGLVSSMLDFYDELRRRQRSVRRFARGLFDELRVERGTDRGSEGLINQTCFLGFTFLAYDRLVARIGALDEHALRRELLARQPTLPFHDLVVAVADHPSDPRGLWPADFDLIGRLTHLRDVHVVMTDEAHDAGFRDRLERELPEIAESRAEDVPRRPLLVTAGDATDDLAFVSRDREEEVRDIARAIRQRADAQDSTLSHSTAIVFHRPLPYLYLGQQVLADARIPFQAFDALPLAAEPYAALLDVVMGVARTSGTGEAIMELLRSSLLAFDAAGQRLSRVDVSALDAALADRRVSGDATTYPAEVDAWSRGSGSRHGLEAPARRAAAAAADAAGELSGYRLAPSASEQVGALAGFLRRHERILSDRVEEWADRHRRARVAVLSVLDQLVEAYRRHDDRHREHDELAAAIHHAIEAQTFMPRRGHVGVHLVDAVAAKFGDFDEVYLVGLAETDWTERQRRSFFYSSGLLKSLGWPQDTDQAEAEHAAFRDVLTLARVRTRLSSFELDGDTVVARSPMIELARGLPTLRVDPLPRGGLFADEVLTSGAMPDGLEDGRAAWLSLRHRRPDLGSAAYSGQSDRQPSGVYRVSQVDRYVTCPFKYFAEHVLRLREERDELSGLTPVERGTLLHTLFERFYGEWQARGRGAISKANLPEALDVFSSIAAAALAPLPDPDRSLEQMRLLGSILGRGVAERVFELEVAAGLPVSERLLERELVGAFTFPSADGPRQIQIRGKADRIDVLEDGSLRVIDYKLGRMPDLDASVQVAVYAHCAQQLLESRDGQPRPVRSAAYLAFGDDRRLEGRLDRTPDGEKAAVDARVADFAAMVDNIEAGEFPPRPKRVTECQWCGFAGVCRKEYRPELDETTDAV
ncbi:MAG: PD-(D/E)XK nuclease family protein [Vicinamibacterales bacterium]